MNRNFNILNKFKGFGNPMGSIWFVGIEESLEIKSAQLDNIIDLYKKNYLAVKPKEIAKDQKNFGKSYTKTYDIMSKIVTDENWKSYKNDNLLQQNSNEFQMNLYPLGKKSTSLWPMEYNNIFLFKSYQEYLNIVKKERFPMLKEYWEDKNPQITICFGISFLQDFKELFDLNDSKEVIQKEASIFYYPTEKIIITPFFDNRNMGWKRINLVKKILTTLKNKPNDKR